MSKEKKLKRRIAKVTEDQAVEGPGKAIAADISPALKGLAETHKLHKKKKSKRSTEAETPQRSNGDAALNAASEIPSVHADSEPAKKKSKKRHSAAAPDAAVLGNAATKDSILPDKEPKPSSQKAKKASSKGAEDTSILQNGKVVAPTENAIEADIAQGLQQTRDKAARKKAKKQEQAPGSQQPPAPVLQTDNGIKEAAQSKSHGGAVVGAPGEGGKQGKKTKKKKQKQAEAADSIAEPSNASLLVASGDQLAATKQEETTGAAVPEPAAASKGTEKAKKKKKKEASLMLADGPVAEVPTVVAKEGQQGAEEPVQKAETPVKKAGKKRKVGQDVPPSEEQTGHGKTKKQKRPAIGEGQVMEPASTKTIAAQADEPTAELGKKVRPIENGSAVKEAGEEAPSPAEVARGTAAKAFKRVKAEEWMHQKAARDNSYQATFGSSGWGARAQEVLGQVRGKDFRHEKTKKKRGSYRGGAIDNNVNSFKFESDDD